MENYWEHLTSPKSQWEFPAQYINTDSYPENQLCTPRTWEYYKITGTPDSQIEYDRQKRLLTRPISEDISFPHEQQGREHDLLALLNTSFEDHEFGEYL